MRIHPFVFFLCLLLLACSPVVETSEEFVENGKFDVEHSLDYLDKIIDHDPRNADALFERAGLELQLSKTLKAKEDIIAAINIEPRNLNYLMLKAKIDEALGQHEEAIRTLEDVIKESGSLPTVESQLFASNIYLKLNDIKKADYFLQKAVINAPYLPEVVYHRARMYAVRHDTARALSFYKMVLQKDSLHQEGLLGVSQVYLHLHKPDSSLFYLNKVTNRNSPGYNELLAKALTRKGQTDSATKFWGKVLLLIPRHAEAHFELGKYYYLRGNWQNASSHFAAVGVEEKEKFKDYYTMYLQSSLFLGDSATAHLLFPKAAQKDSTLLYKTKYKQFHKRHVFHHRDTSHHQHHKFQ